MRNTGGWGTSMIMIIIAIIYDLFTGRGRYVIPNETEETNA